MNAQMLLENFGPITNAPGGVKRLREMIYYLGVTGALCRQDPNEGNGALLLAQVEEEKQNRISAGTFKRSPKLENLRDTFSESLPVIPKIWTWTRLVDIGEISPKNESESDAMASFASMSAISDMHGVPVQPENRPWEKIKKGFTHFANRDVVVAKITPCFENGKSAVIRDLPNEIGAGTTELHVVRPLSGIEPDFIYIFLRSPYFRIVGEAHMTGTAGQKRLPSEYFATRPFPLPPTAEQQRIVAKVDELMALCDKLEAQQQERERRFPVLSRACHARFVEAPSLDNLKAIFDEAETVSSDDLRKTVLSLAVRGKLIPFDAANERQTVGDHFDFLNGYAFKSEWFKSHGIRLCRNANVSHGFLNWSEPAYVSQEVADEFARFALSEGDIVLSLDRPLISTGLKVARIKEDDLPCLLLQRVAKPLHKHNQIDLGFFYLWLKSSDFVDSIDPGRSNGVPHISTRQVQKIPFVLPPLAEQHRIVAKVNQLMALIDKLEEQQARKAKVAQAFAQAAVAAITGTEIKEPEKMKAPKTELVSRLQTRNTPDAADPAPLTKLLTEHNGELPAKALWQRSGLEIDAFYQQLKTEMANGWIIEPEKAFMKEIEAD